MRLIPGRFRSRIIDWALDRNNTFHPGLNCSEAGRTIDTYRDNYLRPVPLELQPHLELLGTVATEGLHELDLMGNLWEKPEDANLEILADRPLFQAMDEVVGRLRWLDAKGEAMICSHPFFYVIDDTIPEHKWRINCTVCLATNQPYPEEKNDG